MIIFLRGDAVPNSAEQLQSAIDAGFRDHRIAPHSVAVAAPKWPEIDSLQVDLTGAALEDPAALPRPSGPDGDSLSVQRIDLSGKPVTVQGVPVTVAIEATSATLQGTSMSDGSRALLLQRAGAGAIELEAVRTDLEALAQRLLSQQARKHGADITQCRLALQSRGPRSLSFELEVTAKMMLMKTPLTVAGDVQVDEKLELRVANLKLTGSGMAAGLARGFLQPHFDRIQQQGISLDALKLGEIRLQDVALALEGDRLRLAARFAS